eukprot:354599-Chlamydomonas_euryale.AAC.3
MVDERGARPADRDGRAGEPAGAVKERAWDSLLLAGLQVWSEGWGLWQWSMNEALDPQPVTEVLASLRVWLLGRGPASVAQRQGEGVAGGPASVAQEG